MSHDFPILYGSEKNGKIKLWAASVRMNDGVATSSIEFGQIDGKKQIATREFLEGKNIGKKNETTPYQQCFNETKKKWQDKKDKEGYVEHLEKIENKEIGPVYPMLAQTYEPSTNKKKKTDIQFPCYVQPKLDGLRCIVYKKDDSIVYQSRTGTFFDTMEHLTPDVTKMFLVQPDIILDGELYTTEFPFEELAGMIKRKKLTDDDKKVLRHVAYHIYDIVDEQKTFETRFNIVSNLFEKNKYTYLKKVQTILCDTVLTFKQKFSEFVDSGYEGIMLRNINGMYRCNYRSSDLQKYKEFFESEYKIIDYKEGDGRDKGAVIWVCETNGKEFCVRPRGTMEMRQEWFENGEKYIGKMLTVIYQELSEQLIPRFPVGKSIRDGY